jgi:hypothetical protein
LTSKRTSSVGSASPARRDPAPAGPPGTYAGEVTLERMTADGSRRVTLDRSIDLLAP